MPPLDELARPSGYAWAIRALHGFVGAWEPPVLGALRPLADALALTQRRKLPLLEADLRALLIPEGDAGHSPQVPRQDTIAWALGALYVLEGSTLGGRVIARHCGDALRLTRDTGMAFFHGYGERTGAMWAAFGAVAESHADSEGARTAMLAGAHACFAALQHHLAEVPPLAREMQARAVHA